MKPVLKAVAAALAALFPLAASLADTAKLETQKSAQHGTYLTDAQGRALYMFEADRRGKGQTSAQSNCYGACATAWPPFIAEGAPQAGAQVDESLISTIERKDGKKQVTYTAGRFTTL